VLVDGVGGLGVVVGAEPGDGGGADVAGLEADDVAVPGVARVGGVAGPEAVVPLADVAGPALGVEGEGLAVDLEGGGDLGGAGGENVEAVPVARGQFDVLALAVDRV